MKDKITITLDKEVTKAIKKEEKKTGVKRSAFINLVLRKELKIK